MKSWPYFYLAIAVHQLFIGAIGVSAQARLGPQSGSLSSYLLHPNFQLYAWGWNDFGQLGIADTGACDCPVRVQLPSGESSWRMIAGGQAHALAIGGSGKLYAWGINNFAQLGLGFVSSNRSAPAAVTYPSGSTGWVAVAAGLVHSLALDDRGQLYAWGENRTGVLGHGAVGRTQVTPSLVPLPAGVLNWTKIAAGETHSLALANTGQMFAWGDNYCGQLGNGTHTNQSAPSLVVFPSGVTAWVEFAIGRLHSVALGNDGQLYAWGNNTDGQLGQGYATNSNQSTPQLVPMPSGASNWMALAAGANQCFALTGTGDLFAWGNNFAGALGVGSTNNQATPQRVSPPVGATAWTAVASGAGHGLGIANNGRLYAWGYSWYGGLGVGSTPHQLTPIQVRGFAPMLSANVQNPVVCYNSEYLTNRFRTRITSPDTRTCVIESAARVSGPWSNRGSFTITRGVVSLTDNYITNYTSLLYRFRVTP